MDLEIKDKSGASGIRGIEFSVKEAGRPIGATRNRGPNKNDAKVSTLESAYMLRKVLGV